MWSHHNAAWELQTCQVGLDGGVVLSLWVPHPQFIIDLFHAAPGRTFESIDVRGIRDTTAPAYRLAIVAEVVFFFFNQSIDVIVNFLDHLLETGALIGSQSVCRHLTH